MAFKLGSLWDKNRGRRGLRATGRRLQIDEICKDDTRRDGKNSPTRCNQLSAWCFCKQRRPDDYSPVGDVWSDETKHLFRGLGDSDKDTVVDLQQSEELQDLSGLGGDLGDTARGLAGNRNGERQTHPLIRTTK
jgi:hypothetical protein